ncbi:hypothetical protein M501DRAFT_906479, partial [Patellaria atrata CBS 101060]
LTGSVPTLTTSSLAGSSHSLELCTRYYTTTVPIWIDELTTPALWTAEFLKPEAIEVIRAVGAWIYVFRAPSSEEEWRVHIEGMRGVREVVEKGMGAEGWDGVMLAVAMGQTSKPALEREVEVWEDECRECGFEYVDGMARGRNELGESRGVERVREALEANEWETDDIEDLDDFGELVDSDDMLHGDVEEFSSMFPAAEADMKSSLLGTIRAEASDTGGIEENEAHQVENLERMMQQLQAIREKGADLPELQRKKYAAKAVSNLMKSM